MKNLYTRQVENLKRRLGQKWVSRWTENPKGRSKQKLGIKAYDYVPSSCHLSARRRFISQQLTSHKCLPHRNWGNKGWSEQSDCSPKYQGRSCLTNTVQYSPQKSPIQLHQQSWKSYPSSSKLIPSRFWKLIPPQSTNAPSRLDLKSYFLNRI